MDINNKSNCGGCEYNAPTTEEYASDFIVEANLDPAEDFTPTPDELEYCDYETSEEFDPQSEQSATTDDTDEFEGDYKDYDSNSMPHNAETSEEFEDSGYEDYRSNMTNNDEVDYTVTEDYDPSDEIAATSDEWYTTESARERCELDDYEIISDVLGSEKQIVKLYSTALCEASEEPFRNIIKENLDEAAADQYKAFEFMQKRGMYQTEQATEQKINEAKQQFTPLCGCNNCGCDNCEC
ncbi:MAG: spore coat protein [Clostridiales bacterium]|nr:spore coat protein [Clostridiales bacterium]